MSLPNSLIFIKLFTACKPGFERRESFGRVASDRSLMARDGQAAEHLLDRMVRLAGLEPAAYGLEVRCSIQLSYRRMKRVAR